MKRKLDEKILEEIRNRVIEKDTERKHDQEIKEMREANIEALTELTSLSRNEVEQIADQVKSDYLRKEKIRNQRIFQFSVLGVSALFILLIILFFIFRPAPEPKIRFIEDNFNDNSYGWGVLNTFAYNRYFKDNQYIMENNSAGWCYWDGIKLKFPKNFDIEVTSIWLNGKYSSYGISVNQSDKDYFAFTLRGDGGISFGKVLAGQWVIDDAFRYNGGTAGKMLTNAQRIEVRRNDFTYYVNNKLIRAGILDLERNSINLLCCGEQQVAFDNIKITNTDTKKIIFTEDFSNPSNLWSPKKEFTCESDFKEGKYILNGNDVNCHWSKSEKHQITNNCEIELTTTWLKGELSSYGLMLLNSDDDYYSFEMQNNGESRLVERQSAKYTYVQDFQKTSYESDGIKSYTQKVIIKDGEIFYYVNDELIKKSESNLVYPCKLALRVCGKQSVAYDNLKIKYYE